MANQTIAFTSVSPIVSVQGLDLNLEYYTEQLGFDVSWRWGSPAVRAGVGRDGLELQLVSDAQFAPHDALTVYFHMRGVADYYEGCVERGAVIVAELQERPWGTREFRVKDRSGNILGFGEVLAAT